MSRFKSFIRYIIGNDPNLILENRVLNLTMFIGAVLIFFIAISNIFVGLNILGIIIPAVTGLILFFLYYLSRFRQKSLLSSLIAIPVLYFLAGSMWFINGGQSGSMIHDIQLFFLFFFAILPRKYHIPFTLFHVIFLSSCYILEYYHPDWILVYNSREAQTFDQIITMALAMVCVYAIMMSIKAIYEEKNKEVIQQKENLEQLNGMKDKMLSVISHDIRSPLTQIKGVLSLVNEGLIGQEKSEYLFKELYKSVHETQDLLDTLVTWASFQLQEGGISLQKENIDLKSTLQEAISLFSSHLKDKNIKIVCTVSTEMNVFSDPNTLLLIIRNLLSNAIKFSYPKGKIIFSAEKTGDYVVLSVKDEGVGIAAERLNGFLKWGKNISTRGTNNEKGSGLGLLLCKDFIEKSGGKLHIESEINKGSTFLVSMPFEKKKVE